MSRSTSNSSYVDSSATSLSSLPSSNESLDETRVEIDGAALSNIIGTEPRKTSLFTLYAKIFRLLLTAQIPNFSFLSDELRNRELENLILPSDEEWRHRVYHSLVELQREKDAEITEDRRMEDLSPKGRLTRKNSQDWEWRPREKGQLPKGRRNESQTRDNSSNAISRTDGSMTEARVEPGWRINDILLAANVLQNIQLSPNYSNEAEMRRVFGLVYDVLRCEIFLQYTN
ncbi:uncharacterized protein LOC105840257 [Monomorium pharaonis]|uniref:uncharacterized protein LOC105840257 n=1 Tax=Monomorium pharaonis TaxID=307658 RepID=UPI001746358E|nr:uncharacterized protein LOC105840257 [Monomorium pharaonis]